MLSDVAQTLPWELGAFFSAPVWDRFFHFAVLLFLFAAMLSWGHCCCWKNSSAFNVSNWQAASKLQVLSCTLVANTQCGAPTVWHIADSLKIDKKSNILIGKFLGPAPGFLTYFGQPDLVPWSISPKRFTAQVSGAVEMFWSIPSRTLFFWPLFSIANFSDFKTIFADSAPKEAHLSKLYCSRL